MLDQTQFSPAPATRRVQIEITEDEIDAVLGDLPGGQGVSPATRRLLQQLFDARRQLREGTSAPGPRLDPGADHIPGLPQLARKPPMHRSCRLFAVRTADVTGVFGLGHIAEGFQASDGAVAWRWLSGPPHNQASWQFYDNRGTAPFEEVREHNDNIEVVWIDPQEEGWHP